MLDPGPPIDPPDWLVEPGEARLDLAAGVDSARELARWASFEPAPVEPDWMTDPDAPSAPTDSSHPHLCGRVDVPVEKMLPSVQLVVHISYQTAMDMCGVARVEGWGPASIESLLEQWQFAKLTVRPVIDLNQVQGVDRYEIPWSVRDAVLNRDLYEAFPGSTRTAKSLDQDHIMAWFRRTPEQRATGDPPLTHPDNLAPLSRRLHRAKTADRWWLRSLLSGRLQWTSPLGFTHIVGPGGGEPDDLTSSATG